MCGGEEIDKCIRHSRRGSGDGMFDKVRCAIVGDPETGSRVATGKVSLKRSRRPDGESDRPVRAMKPL